MSEFGDSTMTKTELTSPLARKLLVRSLLQQMQQSSNSKESKTRAKPQRTIQLSQQPSNNLEQILSNCLDLEGTLEKTLDQLAASERRAEKLKEENEQLAHLALSPKVSQPKCINTQADNAACSCHNTHSHTCSCNTCKLLPNHCVSNNSPVTSNCATQSVQAQCSYNEEQLAYTALSLQHTQLQKSLEQLQQSHERLKSRLADSLAATQAAEHLAERRLAALQSAEQRANEAMREQRSLHEQLRKVQAQLDTCKLKLERQAKVNVTNENLIVWLNKQLTTLQSRHSDEYARPRVTAEYSDRWRSLRTTDSAIILEENSEDGEDPHTFTEQNKTYNDRQDQLSESESEVVDTLQGNDHLLQRIARLEKAQRKSAHEKSFTNGITKKDANEGVLSDKSASVLKNIESLYGRKIIKPELNRSAIRKPRVTTHDTHILDPFRCTINK